MVNKVLIFNLILYLSLLFLYANGQNPINIIWISQIDNIDIAGHSDDFSEKATRDLFGKLELMCTNLCNEKNITLMVKKIKLHKMSGGLVPLDSIIKAENIDPDKIQYIITSQYVKSDRDYLIYTKFYNLELNASQKVVAKQKLVIQESIDKNRIIDPLAIKIAEKIHEFYKIDFESVKWKIYLKPMELSDNDSALVSIDRIIINQLKKKSKQIDEVNNRSAATCFMTIEIIRLSPDIASLIVEIRDRNDDKIAFTDHATRINEDLLEPAEYIAYKLYKKLQYGSE